MSSIESESVQPRNVDNIVRLATESGSNDVAKQRRPSIEERLASKMFTYSRVITSFFIAVTLTLGFAAFHNVPPRVSKPPTARPFFNQSSVILDFYKGHLNAVVKRASDADLSFVMYYAPWDAESQTVRHEFESVAQYYYSRIFFAAINCWHPGSECRTQYSKIQRYPVLMLYPSRDFGIQYKGINTAPYMMRFLDAFMRPFNRITKKEQLTQLLVEYDAVIVGFINFNRLSVSPGYKEFYRAATRFLEVDPNRDVAFAIVTDPGTASKEFDMVSFPSAMLLMWNETLIYPSEKPWTSKNLLNWIRGSLHQVTMWLQPPGVKSLTFSPYLRNGPILFLFTPRNPLHRLNYNYNLLKEVALQYYSRNDILSTVNLVELLKEQNRNAAAKHRERSKRCAEVFNESKIQPIVPSVSVSVQQWINDSCCAKVVMNKCLLCKKTMNSGSDSDAGICNISEDNLHEICKGSDVFKVTKNVEDYEKQFCCDGDRRWSSTFHEKLENTANKKYKSSMLTGENDPRSAKAVRKAFLKEQCTKLLAGNKFHYPIFPEASNSSSEINIKALARNVNKTLTPIAIDSLQYFHFAEGLGIDLLRMRDKTAIVILDADQESQYVMQNPLSHDSLVNFISDYSKGILERTLRSDSSKRFARDFKTLKGCEGVKENEICVPELTTDTFMKVVMDPKMDVVVMYHSPYCAFCSAVAYIYLTVAKYFSKMDHLVFVRIDGDNNDLPWEYSMNRYPSILFFPAKRKEDNTVYPFSLPITIPNLINYLLANLEGDSHVEALVNICSLGSGEPPKDCITRTRRLCLDIIDKLLENYRKLGRNRDTVHRIMAKNRRHEILLKLKHIRDIHLILGAIDHLDIDDPKIQQIRQKFSRYYRSLEALDKRDKKTIKKSVEIEHRKAISEHEKILRDEL